MMKLSATKKRTRSSLSLLLTLSSKQPKRSKLMKRRLRFPNSCSLQQLKNTLALPLDLCEKAGFDSPFMRLPQDLKLKILGYLHCVDLAKSACSCSELHHLCSSDELWKNKFEEEFGQWGRPFMFSKFKSYFAVHWKAKKKSNHPDPFAHFLGFELASTHMSRDLYFPVKYLLFGQASTSIEARYNTTLTNPTLAPLQIENSVTLDVAEAERMNIDMFDGSGLRGVMERLTDVSHDIHLKTLASAVCAVILESGFVHLSTTVSPIRLVYTLCGTTHTVDVVFHILKYHSHSVVNVVGSLSDASFPFGSRRHRLSLDSRKFATQTFEELMLVMTGSFNHDNDQVFELWKMVKDELALPLLVDLCEKAGFDPLPSYLPKELKHNILGYCHDDGFILAKVACLGSELGHLYSSDELWMHKFEEEFGRCGSKVMSPQFIFAMLWEEKKKSKQLHPFAATYPFHEFPDPEYFLLMDPVYQLLAYAS